MNHENKPKYLYRGVVIPYSKINQFTFTGDLTVPYEPILNEKGEKVVLDGNEYGVYMSDNERLIDNVHGSVHGGGTPIRNDLTIGYPPTYIVIPDVAISYKIDTDGVPVRRPMITSVLKGHYNNGYAGDEWIADRVPADKCQITRIRIGKDLLQDAEDVEIVNGDINQAKDATMKKLELRKYHLDSLANEISRMPESQRRNIDSTRMEVLRDIFGVNGVRYININSIDISSNMGKIKYLLAAFYKQNQGTIDYKTLEYIETLKGKIKKSTMPESTDILNQTILEDINLNNEKKESFMQRKADEGATVATNVFDNRNIMMNTILNMLPMVTKQNGDNQVQMNDLRQEKDRLMLAEREILEAERNRLRFKIDPELKAKLEDDLFGQENKPDRPEKLENSEQVEHHRGFM